MSIEDSSSQSFDNDESYYQQQEHNWIQSMESIPNQMIEHNSNIVQ